jgi:hypothetical protein
MTSVYLALGYLGLFLGTVGLLVLLRYRARQDRAPFPENTRLLRAPGESLRQRITELDERLLDGFFLTIGLPAVAYGALLYLAAQLRAGYPFTATAIITLGLLGLIAAFYFGARRLVALIDYRRNVRLGYFGERIVAEQLDALQASGFRVFHDVPAGDPADSPAGVEPVSGNLDHVVVGPTGIFVIETKTRRKGRARVGFMANEIIHDGQTLAYPWGEDRHGLDQAERHAHWLARFIEDQLGHAVPVDAVLVFPGWQIIRKGRGLVHVLGPRELPAFIARPTPPPHELTGHRAPMPDAAALDAIARELEARCRDVEL